MCPSHKLLKLELLITIFAGELIDWIYKAVPVELAYKFEKVQLSKETEKSLLFGVSYIIPSEEIAFENEHSFKITF